ncbi:icmt-1 [Symbiodinium microadriaticum]|nr:icmt-1 [Symbiodinium microadriaticum]CAE7875553.1 icmt-1 [Symbiodinium sp. KB8]
MAAEASEALQLVGEALGQADRALEAAMAWELRTAKAMLQTFLDQVSRRCYELEASEMGPIEASSGQDALDDWYSDPWASPGIARKSSSSSRQGDRRGPRKTSGGLRGPEVETFCLEQLDDAPTEVADAAPLEDVSDPGGGPSEPQWQYGRCVALKLVAHSPHGNSAFEQLLPVLLTVFQVSDDERKSSFLARRRQQGSSWWF